VLQIFGSSFSSGATALRILLVGQLVNVAVGSVGFILIMVGRTGWDLVVYAASFVLDLTVAFILAPRFGIEGAAVAQTVTMVASNTARLYLVWRFVHIQPFSRTYVRLIVPAGAAAVVMLGVRSLTLDSGWPMALVATAVAGLVVYVAVLLAVGLTGGERRALSRLLSRPAVRGPDT
jgi:O-antigen/teichoic acid export membrane protein